MNYPDLHNSEFDSVGTSGLVLFGGELALSYMRDGNTSSFPYFVDLAGGAREAGESPYKTFERELYEEFNLPVTPDQIVYAVCGPSLVRPDKVGWFVVAHLEESAIGRITFGDEGSGYQVTPLEALIHHERLIPRRKQQIQGYIDHLSTLSIA